MPLVDLAVVTVTGAVAQIDGSARAGDKVTFTLFPGSSIPGVVVPSGRKTATVGVDGLLYSGLVDIDDDPIEGVELWAHAEGDEPSQYRVQLPSGEVKNFVLTEGGATDLATLLAAYSTPSAPNYVILTTYADTHLGGRLLSPIPVPAVDAVYRWDGDSFEPVTVHSKAQAAALFLPLAGGSLSGTLTLSVPTSPEIKIIHPVAATTTHVLEVFREGDPWPRVILRYDGHLVFGSGNVQYDIRVKRTNAGLLEIAFQDGLGGNLNVAGKLGVGLPDTIIPAYALDVYGVNTTFRLRNSAGAPTIFTWREDATPTNGDNLFSWEFFGPDSALAYDRYGYMRADSVAVTAGARTGSIYFMTAEAGAEAVRFKISGSAVDVFGTFAVTGATQFAATVRLPNNVALLTRNAANTADLTALHMNGSDVLSLYNGAATLTSAGKFGVGMAGVTPGYELDVYGVSTTFRLRAQNVGPTMITWREDATPTNGDNLFSWEFFGPDSALAYDRYGYMRTDSDVVTAGGRTGSIYFMTSEAGAEAVRFKIAGNRIGIFNTTPAAKQTVTGSRGGNAALASLVTAMATFGWVTDSTTA